MLTTNTLLIIVLGTMRTTNAIYSEHIPMTGDCQMYNEVVRLVYQCFSMVPYTPFGYVPNYLYYWEGPISANDFREHLDQKCSQEIVGSYLECVRNVTEVCPPEKRDAIRREAQESLSICDGPGIVASWINDYALHDFAPVDLICRDYTEMFRHVYPRFEYPFSGTTFDEGLQILRRDVEILFNGVEDFAMNVLQNHPGCDGQGVDSMSVFLIEWFSRTTIGYKMYPEQIARLKALRGL